MEKKTISVHAVTIHIYTIIIVALVILLAIVSFKYLHLKFAVDNFTESAMLMNANQQPAGNISDYAGIIAATVGNYPQGNTLLSQEPVLQNYIVALSGELHRNIVVMSTSKKILADTVAANVGKTYTFDLGHEVDATLKDGVSRAFIEKSPDFPNGLSHVVVVIKNASNQITGAVIVSNATIPQ